jgi:serine protease AprX
MFFRKVLHGIALALAVAAMIVPANALAVTTNSPKIDKQLAGLVATTDPATAVQVILYGGLGLSGTNARLGLAPERALPTLGGEAVTVRAGRLNQIAADPGVVYITADLPVSPTDKPIKDDPNDPAKLTDLFPVIDGAPALWERGIDGSHIGIAVIDSGTSASSDFGDRLNTGVLDTQSYGQAKKDNVGHGSFVSSIAAAKSPDGRYAGIAPDATLYSINVARPSGVYTSDVLMGLEWVRLQNQKKINVHVVVLALSELTPSSYRSSALDTMIERLWADGVVVVIAAGNTGPGTALYAPANDPFAITVGAYDDAGTLGSDDDHETAWSTSGTTQDGFAKPDLLAPGRRIMGFLPPDSELGAAAPAENWVAPNYALMSGTSFSAPQVAGAVALLAQAHPNWTPDEIKWVLQSSARTIAGGTAGALDIAAAVDHDGPVGSANAGIEPSAYNGWTWTTDDFRKAAAGTWDGHSWSGHSWSGNSWNGNSWDGHSWSDNSWDGHSWSGHSWSLSGW